MAGIAAAPGPSADAQTTRAYAAVAAASGLRASYTIPGYVAIEQVVDVGAPVAQSTLESSGLSSAFASTPYPGDTIVSIGGTGAGLGLPTGDVKYPLIARADHPTTPTAELVDPTDQFALRSAASADHSEAHAELRPGAADLSVTKLTATSTIDRADDGSVTATAVTSVDGVSLADGVVRIGSIRSSSTTTLPLEGDPITDARLVIAGVTIAGQDVGIGAEGIRLGATEIPLPVNTLLDALRTVLADNGVGLRVLAGEPVVGGGAADILELRVRHTTPPPGPPEATLVFRIGGATTSILTGEPVPPLPEVGAVEPPPEAVDLGLAPPGAGPAPAVAAPRSPGSPAIEEIRHRRDQIDIQSTMRWFFTVIAVGGGLGIAASAAWTTLGVRGMVSRTWTRS